MIADKDMWDEAGERLLVQAVHEAMRWRRAQIRKETDGPKAPLSKATTNRWERFAERLRLALAGAKREADVRFALTDLFSRAGKVKTLQLGWQHVHAVFRKDWQLARDLGLLALASYKSPAMATSPTPTETTTQN